MFVAFVPSAATEATDTDEDSALMEKIQEKVAAEKAKVAVSDKEELFKVSEVTGELFVVTKLSNWRYAKANHEVAGFGGECCCQIPCVWRIGDRRTVVVPLVARRQLLLTAAFVAAGVHDAGELHGDSSGHQVQQGRRGRGARHGKG